MKKTHHIVLGTMIGVACLLTLTACTKELVYGKDQESPSVSKKFRQGVHQIFEASKITLKNLGYKIDYEDESTGFIKTGWMPTKSDSHYMHLFDREDYGTVAAYYQLEVRIHPSDADTEVDVSAPVRSIARHIKSSHRTEKKFLKKLEHQLRGSDLHMSNVKVEDK